MSLISRRSVGLALCGLILLTFGFLGYAKSGTVTLLSSYLNPSVFGQSVTFQATVVIEQGGPDIPSGSINFVDETTSTFLGSAPIIAVPQFVATLNVSTLAVGVHLIRAEYQGSADTWPSLSDPLYQTVNKASTTITIGTIDPEPSTVGGAYAVSVTLEVDPPAPGAGTPTGTITVDDGVNSVEHILTGSEVFPITITLTSTSAGTKLLTAAYLGDANFNTATATKEHDVSKGDVVISTSDTGTPLGFDHTPDPSFVGQQYTVSGYVVVSTGVGTPTGTVTVNDGDGNSCAANVVSGAWSCTLTSTSVGTGTKTLTATYEGDENFNGSSDTESHMVKKRATKTTITGSDTPLIVNDTGTFTVTVTDTSPGTPTIPTGDVTVSVSPSNQGNMTPPITLALDAAGQATFTYTPSSAATTTHTFTASYNGDAIHNGSSGTFDQSIIERAIDIKLICSPIDAYIHQTINCQVILSDDTTAGTVSPPNESYLALYDDRWGTDPTYPGNARFGAITWTTNGGDRIGAFTYTPTAWDTASDQTGTPPSSGAQSQDTATITATFTGSDVHVDATAGQPLTVRLRPTEPQVEVSREALLVNEKETSAYFKVTDIADAGSPSPPAGNVALSTSDVDGRGTSTADNLSGPTLGGDYSQWTFDYVCTGLDEQADFDVITAEYNPNDGIHSDSTGTFHQGVKRRPTVTTIDDCSDCTSHNCSTADGWTLTVTAKEDSGNAGTDVDLQGKFVLLGNEDMCTGLSGFTISCDYSRNSDAILDNATVQFVPTDNVHLASTVSTQIDRSCQFDPAPAPSDPSACDAGCGTGGLDINQMIFNQNTAALAMHVAQMALEIATTVADVIPDPVVVCGFGCSAGSTIPASDIAAAVAAGAGIALEVAITAMTEDLDGDGLPGVIEPVVGTDDSSVDSDGDAMGDMDEIGYAGGYYGGSRRPDPTNPDSDGDGLMDGYELAPFSTDVCVADTDCDTLPDGIEIACLTAPDEANGFYRGGYESYTDTFAPLATTLGYTAGDFPGLFTDPRDQPNPREGDTDGDGLRDDVEFGPGLIVTSSSASPYSPFINDADSDGDGILDGNESTNGDAIWDGSVATTGTNVTIGETHLCLADTDGDGLLDGEEEQLFGRGAIEVHSTLGTLTITALDDDSDDDGLSDYEEVNITQTDPLNWDTDGDSLSDANELLAVSGSWPQRTFTQVSDPLDPDTDDDGLGDEIEYSGTGLETSQGLGGVGDTVCPYVNDDDSDDDGLQDGTESWNGDDTITTLDIGNTATQATTSPTTGETDFCNPDTDGDGLTDGEEAALLGGLPVSSWQRATSPTGFTPVTPKGVSTTFGQDGASLDSTVPPLDDDSDNDGLSDYEEVNITGTDPLDQDTDNDTLMDSDELIATGGVWPMRTFMQVSDPLDPDTDDDGIQDQNEYSGSGLGTGRGLGGADDTVCPYVNDDDSDDDGLQDGVEDANHDGTWGVGGAHAPVGSFSTQATTNSDGYYETDLCNPDTDGDGLLDGEEVQLIGGGPVLGRPADWPANQPSPGFNTVSWEAVSTVLPLGTSAVPGGYSHTAPSPGTGNDLIAPYTFDPIGGTSTVVTVPALDVDSDNDGLSDYEEVNITGTDPLDQDTDNDTLMDSDELIATGGTPGATPRRTFDQESDPLDINTDDDHLFDPQEYPGSGLSLLAGALSGVRDLVCPFVNDDDSDDDGIQDGAVVTITPAGVITSDGSQYTYTHYEDFIDLNVADVAHPGIMRTVPTHGDGEQQDDALWNVCDPDSDGDGLNDGEEIAIGTNPDDWDTDDDGRNDWHEVTGGGPIPTDPFDPDTDDDGLLDSAEVFGLNNTNPLNADTDGDGLCDGGTGTPWMTSGDARVVVNPICKSCSDPGLTSCGTLTRSGSADGIGDHPNPHGYGEDKNGNGAWDGTIGQLWQSGDPGTPETDPNQYDTDGDAEGDGIEVLGFSTSRQGWIPTTDLFGRTINVPYPTCGCLEPLIADTDGDGLEDGYEDNNHDGNFDFLPSDFDYAPDPLPGPPQPNPNETNPCNPDTDDDDLTDYEERYQSQVFVRYPDSTLSFNPTNPLDHDTDNDRLLDGFEVKYVCVAVTYSQLDNDGDALIDEDPVDGLDNDGDGLIDEDPVDFFVRFVPMLDPTNRDSDSDGFIDGLDDDPCNSELIPLLPEVQIQPIDTDGDGFSDDDEIVAGTHPNDPEEYPIAYCMIDLDFDQEIDDRLWLEPTLCCGIANSVAIDIDSNVLIDARVRIIAPRDVKQGDFDGDGAEDDYRYVVEYAFGNYRVVQPRILLTIDDYNGDLTIDHAEVVKK